MGTVTFRYTATARDVVNTIDTTQPGTGVNGDRLLVYSKGGDLNDHGTGLADFINNPTQVTNGKVTIVTTFAADGSGVAKFVDAGAEEDTLTSKVKTDLPG